MTVSTPSFRDDLTAEQVKLVEALKADVSSIVENNAALKVFCSEHTYVRYLRARQWNLQKAAKMLHTTLEWRMENKPHLIRFEDIKPECVTGKTYVYPDSDKQGRPIVLMRPRLENTKTYDRQVKYLIYVLEQASRVADQRGVGKMTWLLDFEEYSMSNAPPLQVSLNCNHILQHHYPERLAAAVCYHAPWLFSMTWKAVRPFVDSVTQKKILFADKGAAEKQVMNDNFHLEKLETCLGGAIDGFVFDLEKFEQECRAYDAEVASELAAMEARLKEPSMVALPAPDSNQVTEQVVEA